MGIVGSKTWMIRSTGAEQEQKPFKEIKINVLLRITGQREIKGREKGRKEVSKWNEVQRKGENRCRLDRGCTGAEPEQGG